MKKNQSQNDRPLHQTVAEVCEFKVGPKSIAVAFTDQQLSAHAGSATFWAWLHGTRWGETLAQHLPHRPPQSNHHLTPLAKALAFTHGLLGEARKLTHVAYFRRDPLVPGPARYPARRQPVEFVAVLRGFHLGGHEPAVFPAAVAVGRHAAALAPRGLHARSGLDAPAARGRPSGRCRSRLHAAGPQAVSASAARRQLALSLDAG